MRLDNSFIFLLGTVAECAWPYGPFSTSGSDITNTLGERIIYAGANWPGAADVMIPEGLQYASIDSIVSSIKSLGMNAIRLTFAIELIDDIFENGGDVKISDALETALGTVNGSLVFAQIIENNPTFNANSTRLDVYDAIAAACFAQEIYVHLDNHISKAGWCCSTADGNSWFGDVYFNVSNWQRGLQYMVEHGAAWGNLMSIGLRNELRQPDNATLALTYNWTVWYDNMVPASQVVNTANPDILIFFSGLNFDTYLTPIIAGNDLGNGQSFLKDNFTYADKMVMELHNYENSITSCSSLQSNLQTDGFSALSVNATNTFPVVVTEWGADVNTGYSSVYATCLEQYLPSVGVGWLVWVLSGSYYIRQGVQDSDESWGLFDHEWSGWRNETTVEALVAMVAATVA